MFDLGGEMYNLAGAHVLFRGVQMTDDEIAPYDQNNFTNTFSKGDRKDKPMSIKLPSYLSCSRKPLEALKFAFGNPKPDH